VAYIVIATMFLAAMLLALAGLHVTVQTYWREMLLALRGELGRDVMASSPPARAAAA